MLDFTRISAQFDTLQLSDSRWRTSWISLSFWRYVDAPIVLCDPISFSSGTHHPPRIRSFERSWEVGKEKLSNKSRANSGVHSATICRRIKLFRTEGRATRMRGLGAMNSTIFRKTPQRMSSKCSPNINTMYSLRIYWSSNCAMTLSSMGISKMRTSWDTFSIVYGSRLPNLLSIVLRLTTW